VIPTRSFRAFKFNLQLAISESMGRIQGTSRDRAAYTDVEQRYHMLAEVCKFWSESWLGHLAFYLEVQDFLGHLPVLGWVIFYKFPSNGGPRRYDVFVLRPTHWYRWLRWKRSCFIYWWYYGRKAVKL
jgi:hypothetical protein